MNPWITLIGLGEDGLENISSSTKAIIEGAEILVGGARHLGKIPDFGANRITWGNKLIEKVSNLKHYRGKKLVILASGDPMEFGVGATLLKYFSPDEIFVIPSRSSFSLVAAKMCWPLSSVERISLHGRSFDELNYFLYPKARILILSWDGTTPKKLANYLTSIGLGNSQLDVFENLGGKYEQHISGTASNWSEDIVGDLNTIALRCCDSDKANFWSRLPGLPENAFDHDGNITKKEIRSITLSALSPLPGQTLWDIGAGSGAIGIEWLRSEIYSKAVAIEKNTDKCAIIKSNASKLGVPRLQVFQSIAPAGLCEIRDLPDAIFVGGGVSNLANLKSCWSYLSDGGCFVANAVTLEAQRTLMDFKSIVGGDITSISISRSSNLGEFTALRPMMSVLQFKGIK